MLCLINITLLGGKSKNMVTGIAVQWAVSAELKLIHC